MAKFTSEQIRNICFLGHGGSGKTTLNEAMLFLAKHTDRMGKASEGNSVSDYHSEEINRGFSIYTSLSNVEWNNTKINVLDAPGFLDFIGEVLCALKVAETSVIVVDGKGGVEVGTELAWNHSILTKTPKSFFVNKIDDPDSDFDKILEDLIEKFGPTVCPVVVPMDKEGTFVNVLNLKQYKYGKDGKVTVSDADADSVASYRERLFETIAAVDEDLMDKFFAGEEITAEEGTAALCKGIASNDISPVYAGAAQLLWGVSAFMDSVSSAYPSPLANEKIATEEGGMMEVSEKGPATVHVFKTTADQFGRITYFKVMSGELDGTATLRNVDTGTTEKFSHYSVVMGKKLTEVDSLCFGDIGAVAKLNNTNTNDTLTGLSEDVNIRKIKFPEPFLTMAIIPKAKGEEDKIAQSILRRADSDKTLRFESDPETKQLLISGIGDMQIDVVIAKLKAKGIDVKLEAPRIAYRETIRKKVQCEGKHKKQSGGHGQYGHVKITFGPGEEDGLTFTTSVVGGSVPKNYFPAVEKGLQEAMKKGVLAGYPVVGLAADLYDGSYHDVDSNELSFKMAASIAYKEGLAKANPVLLEPIGELKVTIPDVYSGNVMGDINGKRRGSVLGSTATPGKIGYTTIEAEIPKAEMSDYSIALRAMTQGRGEFTYYFTRYQEVPGNIAQKVIAEAKARADED